MTSVIENTLIQTTEGLKPIGKLIGVPFKPIYLSNVGSSEGFFESKKEICIKITLANGSEIVAPEGTLFTLYKGEECLLENLELGDRIRLGYTRNIEWGDPDEFDEGESMGRLEVNMTKEMLLRSSSYLKGYLSGLFSARGGAYRQTNGSLRYVSAYNDLTRIQQALWALGIHSNIQENKTRVRWLNITSSGIFRFIEDVGLKGEIKDKLNLYMEEYVTPTPKLQRNWAEVKTLEYMGELATYKSRTKGFRNLMANGFITNYGE